MYFNFLPVILYLLLQSFHIMFEDPLGVFVLCYFHCCLVFLISKVNADRLSG